MSERRERKDGSCMYVVNPTIPEKSFKNAKAIALECSQPMTAVLRVALVIGLGRMERELNKHRAGEESKWEMVLRDIGTDGRSGGRKAGKD